MNAKYRDTLSYEHADKAVRRRVGRVVPRRGISTLWLILFLPLLMIMLAVVVEIGNLWLARQELEDALEAAALASVKSWGDGDTIANARTIGTTFFNTNSIRGQQYTISTNLGNADINLNADQCDGNLIFGGITQMFPNTFCPTATPGCGGFGRFSMDATGAFAASDNGDFGIYYYPPLNQPANNNFRVIKIEIDLFPTRYTSGSFPMGYNGPMFTNTTYTPNVTTSSGINAGGVVFSPAVNATYLIIDLPNTGNPANDLNHDDWLRFRAKTLQLGPYAPNAGPNDGDGFGANTEFSNPVGSRVKITFYNAGDNTTSVINTFFVNTCFLPPSPNCPRDNQSIVSASQAGGGDAFAVKAQRVITVPSVFANIFSFGGLNSQVQAEAYARYDCLDSNPRLVRISNSCISCP